LASCRSDGRIKIGFMGTLSGPNNDLAVNGFRGIEIAVQEINKGGGINGRLLELVVKDTLNDKEVTKGIVDEFIREKVNFVIGDYTSTLTETAVNQDSEDKILFLSPTASADTLVGLDDNLIRFCGISSKQAEIILKQAQKNGDRNFVVIKAADNAAYVDPLNKRFNEIIGDSESKVLEVITVSTVEIAHAGTISRNIIETYPECDAILYLIDALNTIIFIQALRELNNDITIYTSFWANTRDLYKLGGTSIEGIHTLGFNQGILNSEKGKEFKDRYVELFGYEPGFEAYFSHDALMSLLEALSAVKQPTVERVKAEILKKGGLNSLHGYVIMDKYGDSYRSYKSLFIKDGQPVGFEIN